jgi:hypothetical protein
MVSALPCAALQAESALSEGVAIAEDLRAKRR